MGDAWLSALARLGTIDIGVASQGNQEGQRDNLWMCLPEPQMRCAIGLAPSAAIQGTSATPKHPARQGWIRMDPMNVILRPSQQLPYLYPQDKLPVIRLWVTHRRRRSGRGSGGTGSGRTPAAFNHR